MSEDAMQFLLGYTEFLDNLIFEALNIPVRHPVRVDRRGKPIATGRYTLRMPVSARTNAIGDGRFLLTDDPRSEE